MPKKKALITGINGQDGSYLAELLLEKGYEVVGTMRRSSIENSNKMSNIRNIADKIKIHTLSLENNLSVYKLFLEEQPDECYHLAAASFVSFSFEDEISNVYISMDLDEELLLNVEKNSLIITHHPLIFLGLKRVNFDTYSTKLLKELIKKDISLISMHTKSQINLEWKLD